MFCRYALRTTDPVAGRAFYADALGLSLPDGMSAESALEAWPLHERARARGAPAHWLGLLAVGDVDVTAKQLLSRGSEPLGAPMQAQDGTPFATFRDPFGTVIGIRSRGQNVTRSPVAWHQLHTADADGAWALYHDLFGWAPKQTLEVPDLPGGYRLFAWNDAEQPAGMIGNTARSPGVHPHWLLSFPVTDIARAVARVRELGGTALEPSALPDGTRLCACEDPQGAAFGLLQHP